MELSVLKTQRERQMAQALLERRQNYTPVFNVSLEIYKKKIDIHVIVYRVIKQLLRHP